ncbi:MAG: bacteriohemerythrin [Leptospiraceae bacterium]|nr:bacteriohemerythrin [Leptospiraceae bacterium]
MNIEGYKNISKIYESQNSILYRGIRNHDSLPVIIKILSPEYPSQNQILSFKNEFEYTKDSSSNLIRKALELTRIDNKNAIILEDFDGLTLLNYLESNSSTISELIEISISICKGLEEVHSQNIIHKDINMNNILISESNHQIKIIDFGISTRLDLKTLDIIHPDKLEGTISYISPEQTGRMNRSVDFRSDLYSLGIVFFEMFTGRLPFISNDPIELVHQHIAQSPPDPNSIRNDLPPTLSKIILKLLSKSAEERYQSATGLISDLEKLKQNINSYFIPGEHDVSSRLIIPQKLYGREKDVMEIFSSYEKTCMGTKEVLLLSGYSGSGKSVLVHEIYRILKISSDVKSYFLSGKFQEFQKDLPYSPWIQAFQSFIKSILSEGENEIQTWKERIQSALQENGKVITDIIPDLELIIGKQKDVPDLGGKEAQNRFNYVFSSFLECIAQKHSPLVLFIDDWQWADVPSLDLLKVVLSDHKIKYLFFIGTYRSNEVTPSHPFTLSVNELKESGISLQSKHLENLGEDSIHALLHDTLKIEEKELKELSSTLLGKTKGNPFFLIEILRNLYREGILYFKNGKWNFEMSRLSDIKISDNVVDFLATSLSTLDTELLDILKYASSYGNQFDLRSLVSITKLDSKSLSSKFEKLIERGLLIPLNTNFRFVLFEESDSKVFNEVLFKFSHDRIREAIYTLIPENEKKSYHLSIARYLYREHESNLSEIIFDISNQYNLCLDSITEESEKDIVAKLNYQSALKAKTSSAYDTAHSYFLTSIQLKSDSIWNQDPKFAFELYHGLIETSYLSGRFEEMEAQLENVLKKIQTTLEKSKLFEIKILSLISRGQLQEAVSESIEILKELNIFFPEVCDFPAIQKEMGNTMQLIAGRSPEDLLNLPEMDNEEAKIAIHILSVMFSAAFFVAPPLVPFIVFNQLALSLKFGNTGMSAFAYANFGLIFSGIVGDIPLGKGFGILALNLLDKLKADNIRTRTTFIYNWLIRHWSEPIQNSLPDLLNAYKWGLQTGDLEYVAHSVNGYLFYSYFIGKELTGLETEMRDFHTLILSIKQEIAAQLLSIYRQSVSNLIGANGSPTLLEGEFFKESIALDKMKEVNDRHGLCMLFIHKTILSLHFAEYQNALQFIKEAEQYLDGAVSLTIIPNFHYLKSLCLLLNDSQSEDKEGLMKEVTENQEKLLNWANHSPTNYRHKYLLVEAEKNRVLSQNDIARGLYDEAISKAKSSESLGDESLALQLTAEFYNSTGNEFLFKTYITECFRVTSFYGANAKLTYLTNKYSFLKASKRSGITTHATTRISTSSSTGTYTYDNLDLLSIIKVSDTLSGEIVLENLLEKIMNLVLENAGANRGLLFLNKNNKWYLDAASGLKDNQREVNVLMNLSIDDEKAMEYFPKSLISYIIRFNETLVIADLIKEREYSKDPYVMEKMPKSVLAMPLKNKGKTTALLYLENNLVSGAFVKESIDVLNILSSQLAISIENASLYKNLQESLNHQVQLTNAYSRFVPKEFLDLLEKSSILDIRLGDQVQKDMTVLFSDIRSFTTLSEGMSPAENFKFINDYLGKMEPAIGINNGFIDKYIGDAIMALFPGSTDEALKASIDMLENLKTLNNEFKSEDRQTIKIGIGLNSGNLMLGTVGGSNRMEGTVISDAVNIASRIESLTKEYGVSLLISEKSYFSLKKPSNFHIRFIDNVRVKGKTNYIGIYEIYDQDPPNVKELKNSNLDLFNEAVSQYHLVEIESAKAIFQKYLSLVPEDSVAQKYLLRCDEYIASAVFHGDEFFAQKIEWNNDLITGNKQLDAQHMELFKRMNLVLKNINEDPKLENFNESLTFLENYTNKHFHLEESIMEETSYPGYSFHKEQHEKFILEIAELRRFQKQNLKIKFPLILRLRSQVVNWFIDHILTLDMKLSQFLKHT